MARIARPATGTVFSVGVENGGVAANTASLIVEGRSEDARYVKIIIPWNNAEWIATAILGYSVEHAARQEPPWYVYDRGRDRLRNTIREAAATYREEIVSG